MNVTFACPRCEETGTAQIAIGAAAMACPKCRADVPAADGAWSEGALRRCLICGSPDLFVRKDFPQRLGLAIVVIGFAASCVTWFYYWTYLTFAILFATAFVDMALYLIVGESLVCYRCHAEYRAVGSIDQHGPFSLETHERYRQQAARLAQVRRVSGATTGEVPAGGEPAAR
ncbi:MAG: hypothetical protein HYX69_18125 [Planctomycetia bacterium]|nr:hypothetical protein [Planctomycetia bacterium]